MSRANYFYIVAYPEYSGFRIEHDPVFTAYIANTETPPSVYSALGVFVVIVIVVAAIAIIAAILILRRNRNFGAN